jgi:hypothetical protein
MRVTPEREWQCPCGKWLPEWTGRCVHMHQLKDVLGYQDMLAIRAAEEAGLAHGIDATAQTCNITYYWRTGAEPKRDKA